MRHTDKIRRSDNNSLHDENFEVNRLKAAESDDGHPTVIETGSKMTEFPNEYVVGRVKE